MTDLPTTYAQLVNYDELDYFKRLAQRAAMQTDGYIEDTEWRVVPESRGESVFLLEGTDRYRGDVNEGLGTKNNATKLATLTAIEQHPDWSDNAHYHYTKLLWGYAGQDTVAMIVNDMATLGVRPLTIAMHLAAGHSSWFDHKQERVEARMAGLLEGWVGSCRLSLATYAGGETPALPGLVVDDEVVISGSATGEIYPKNRRIMGDVEPGDEIIILEGSGPHANGISLLRSIGEEVGYQAELSDGNSFANALLQPTPIYVHAVQACLDAGVEISYTINVTGHGWRKFMRLNLPLEYRFHAVPTPQVIFSFAQEVRGIAIEEMLGNYCMNAGFGLYVRPGSLELAMTTLAKVGYKPLHAGTIHPAEAKVVNIVPYKVVFEADTLQVR